MLRRELPPSWPSVGRNFVANSANRVPSPTADLQFRRIDASQFTGLKLSVEKSDCMICSFWFEKRTLGPKLIGAMMPVSTFLVFSSSAMVQAQVGCLPHRSIAEISTLAAA